MRKMEFEEFAGFVEKMLPYYLPDPYRDAEYARESVQKMNTSYEGLVIKTEGITPSPIINLNAFYQDYLDGATYDSVMDSIVETIKGKNISIVGADLIDLAKDYEKAKEHLCMRVCNLERNSDFLEYAVHRNEGEFAITYHLEAEGDGGVYSTTINTKMLEGWGITAEQLFEDGARTQAEHYPVICKTLISYMGAGEDPEEPGPFILTNTGQVYGAVTLFYPGVMDQAAEKMQGNYFVLPSSIHEVLLVPEDDPESFHMLQELVKDVNDRIVSSSDWLSDEVYHYDAIEKMFEKASDYADRVRENEMQIPQIKKKGIMPMAMEATSEKEL